MKQTSKDRLFEILDIINFTEDRNKFVQEFEAMSHLETTVNLIDNLPQGVEELLKKHDPTLIKEYISKEAYFEEIKKVWNRKLMSLISAVGHTLSISQKEKIKQALAN